MTSELLNWILGAFSTLTGATTFMAWFMYRKQEKRFKTAEAFEKEVLSLRLAMNTLQEQVKWYGERLNETQALIVSKDAYITQISGEKHTLEIKNSRNKNAINKAFNCRFCEAPSECPVLIQRASNEEEYLKQIERKNNVDSNN